MKLKNIGHVSNNAHDMEAIRRFYEGILDMENRFSTTYAELAASARRRFGDTTPISQGGDRSLQFWLTDPDDNRLELM